MKKFIIENFHLLPSTLLILHSLRTIVFSATVADSLIILSLASLTGFFMWIQSKIIPEKELPPELAVAQEQIAKMRIERDLAIASSELMKVNKAVGAINGNERKHNF